MPISARPREPGRAQAEPPAPAPARTPEAHGPAAEALVLQRAVGNRAARRMLARREPYGEAVRTAREVRRSRNLYSREKYLKMRLVDPQAPNRDDLLAQARAIDLQVAKVGARADQGDPANYGPEVEAQIAARQEALRLIAWRKSAREGLGWADDKLDTAVGREQVALVRRDVEAVKKEFRSAAYDNAYKLLSESTRSIVGVLQSYGLMTAHADDLARNVAFGYKTRGEAVTEWLAYARSNTAVFNDRAKADKRESLGQTARRLHDLRSTAAELKAKYLIVYRNEKPTAPVGSSDPQRSLYDRMKAAETASTVAQGQAEIAHPLLTAYRDEDVDDLRGADVLPGATDEVAAMRELLSTTIERLANIKMAEAALRQGKVTPLDLGPIVGITRAQMLIARGTSWDGAINDLIRAESKRDSFAMQVLQVVLSALSLVPGFQVFGLLAIGLDLYTAGSEYVQYGLDKAFAGTALDRAKALSDRTPSLLGFAFALVSAGLNAVAVRSAFKEAEQLRIQALQGEQEAIDALNALGKEHGVPNLADEATGGAKTARAKRPAPKPDETPKPRTKPDEPPKGRKPDTAKPKKPPAKPPPLPAAVQHGNAVREAVEEVLITVKPPKGVKKVWGMQDADLPPDFILVRRLLADAAGTPGVKRLSRSTEAVMAGMRTPKHWADVLGEAATRAARNQTSIKTELFAMARERGLAFANIDRELAPDVFFRDYASQRLALYDESFEFTRHGATSHVLQDLVADRALKAASKAGQDVYGSVGDFRASLGGFRQQVTFIDRLSDPPVLREMPLGEAVWRSTYDLFQDAFAPTPEFLMEKLRAGLKNAGLGEKALP